MEKKAVVLLRWTRNANTLDLLLEILWVRRLLGSLLPQFDSHRRSMLLNAQPRTTHKQNMPPQVNPLPRLYTARFYAQKCWTRNANTLDLLLEILWVRRLWSHFYPSSTPIGDPCCSTLNHEQHTNKICLHKSIRCRGYTQRDSMQKSVDKSSSKTRQYN